MATYCMNIPLKSSYSVDSVLTSLGCQCKFFTVWDSCNSTSICASIAPILIPSTSYKFHTQPLTRQNHQVSFSSAASAPLRVQSGSGHSLRSLRLILHFKYLVKIL